jgi:bifunctional UDP-N-acetylglucosamine pyrophosphorylase/glucosamine-1-phosphate N-acetyltransferase
MAFRADLLKTWLQQLNTNNAQGEYYLTDTVAIAHQQNIRIGSLQTHDPNEVQGVNNRLQLAELERAWQLAKARELALNGATVADPNRLDIRGELTVGRDVSVDINVVFEGNNILGNRVSIGPNVVLIDCVVGDDTHILANSHLENAIIQNGCQIGPFARLRAGTELRTGAKIGNFVETKKTIVGVGSKINHLSYVGDAELGEAVNVGAGTITCNYDGVNKSRTIIGSGAFIGSNTALVAPVTVGENATVGAGSVITTNVPDKDLAVARSKQRNISGWKRPVKIKAN